MDQSGPKPKALLFDDNARARYSSHKSEEVSDEVQIYTLPENEIQRSDELVKVATSTGFPVDFSTKALRAGKKGFVSIRTSKESIPRGSFAIVSGEDLIILADYKTTGVGSKSKLRGMGKGKLLMLRVFWDKREEEKINDKKDNNYLSKFPDRKPDHIMSQKDVKELNKKFIANKYLDIDAIKEARIYNGLIYFSMQVPAYDVTEGDLSKITKNDKHYCQEAETLASILFNLSKNLYKDPIIDKGFLYFKDDNNNLCRIDLKNLIMPAELSQNGEYKEDSSQKLALVKTIPQLQRLVTELDPNLQFCHAPIFARSKDASDDAYVPVMVQTGDSGEGITRDSDFEHFYKHPLIPAIAHKSFNAAQQFRPGCNRDHLDGLELLELRLQATSLDEFKKTLDKFIKSYIGSRSLYKLPDTIMLDEYILGQLREKYPHLAAEFKAENKLSAINSELQRIILLAKYGDVTTLSPDSPYINYMTEDFASYREAVTNAKEYYENDEQALNNLGESSAHDMVFLLQMDHRMASHGDEGGHPKGKPEDFARITTYCNDRVIVTSSEEQYLTLLFTNPEMLEEQIITVHPYWMKDIKEPDMKGEYTCSDGWVDLLKIQALRYVLAVSERVSETDLQKTYDMYVQCVLINMPRRFVKDVDIERIEQIRQKLTRHFMLLKLDLTSREAIQKKIEQLYDNPRFVDKNAYRVYTPPSSSAAIKAIND